MDKLREIMGKLRKNTGKKTWVGIMGKSPIKAVFFGGYGAKYARIRPKPSFFYPLRAIIGKKSHVSILIPSKPNIILHKTGWSSSIQQYINFRIVFSGSAFKRCHQKFTISWAKGHGMSWGSGDFDPHTTSDIHGRYTTESNDLCLWLRVFEFTIKAAKTSQAYVFFRIAEKTYVFTFHHQKKKV